MQVPETLEDIPVVHQSRLQAIVEAGHQTLRAFMDPRQRAQLEQPTLEEILVVQGQRIESALGQTTAECRQLLPGSHAGLLDRAETIRHISHSVNFVEANASSKVARAALRAALDGTVLRHGRTAANQDVVRGVRIMQAYASSPEAKRALRQAVDQEVLAKSQRTASRDMRHAILIVDVYGSPGVTRDAMRLNLDGMHRSAPATA